MKKFELIPTDSHRSFYKKAIVTETDEGEIILTSYCTDVAKIDRAGGLHRLWHGWSATTGRHVAAFCETYGFGRMNKADWEKIPD